MKHIKTFSDFRLNENNNFKEIELKDAIKLIKQNCKQWLSKHDTNTVLVRSVEHKTDFSFVEKVNRKSTSAVQSQVIFDNIKSWKHLPKRSQSTCCTSLKELDEDDFSDVVWKNGVIVIPFDDSNIGICNGDDFNYASSWPNIVKILGEHTMMLEEFVTQLYYMFINVYGTNASEKGEYLKKVASLLIEKGPGAKMNAKYLSELLDNFDKYLNEISAEMLVSIKKSKRSGALLTHFLDSKMSIEDWLSDILSPEKNGFISTSYSGVFKAKNKKEVFTDGKCLLVRIDFDDEDESPYHNLIKNL